jgi:hypothetical protein
VIGGSQGYTRAMSSLGRLLLIWLVAFALPAQGIAAATLKFCAPAHESQLRLLAVSAHERHGEHHRSVVPSGAAAEQGGATDPAQQGKLNCSACAACCAATALPAAPLTVPAIEPAVERVTARVAAYVSPVGMGLERPPRQRFA